MILYTLLFTPQGYEYKLLQRYIQTLPQTTLFMASLIGYEPANLTVHPPPQNCRGWVHFFRIGV